MDSNTNKNRYHQQVLLKGFGESAQHRLKQARVFVAGAGGLGCAALQYMAAAGIGKIGIADDDIVQLENLHRQVLYSMNDLGSLKVEIAARKLSALNPEVIIRTYPLRLSPQNILGIIEDYDIVLDGTDNRESRYMINDACVLTGKPLVFGAILQFAGQLAVFNCPAPESVSANYRDVFPVPIPGELDISCHTTGVLGVLPGIIGCMQCNETIKLITGIGTPLINKFLIFNALNNQINEFEIHPQSDTRSLIPADKMEFMSADYAMHCLERDQKQFELPADEFMRLLEQDNITVIDVRETNGDYSALSFRHLRIPLSELPVNLSKIGGDTVVAVCNQGIASLHAARLLKDAFGPAKKIYSLSRGLHHLNRINGEVAHE